MKVFANVIEFYKLMKQLDDAERASVVAAYDATGDDGVQTILEGFASSHANETVRDLAQAAIDARAAD